jgi:hypothetical protein
MGYFHQLARDRTGRPAGADAAVRPARPLRLVHTEDSPGSAASRIPDADSPRRLAARLAQAIAEVLARARPAGQLDELLTSAAVRALQRAADVAPARADSRVRRPTVASLRLTTPRSGVIEACAVIDVGTRKRALAFRLEVVGDRWQCTALRVG